MRFGKQFGGVSIIGSAGVPATYGGFETLVENLIRHHDAIGAPFPLTVFCSRRPKSQRLPTYLSARLRYLPFKANGMQSVLYDTISIILAILHGSDVILVLGISGAVALPFVRRISSARIVTNVDGIEWKRKKWRGIARHFLRVSERLAARYSHSLIADNAAIQAYLLTAYNVSSRLIAYGGDHAISTESKDLRSLRLPHLFAFSVCRIEPENNIELILNSFSTQNNIAIVIVGNWNGSPYGRGIRNRYRNHHCILMLDPIYDLGILHTMRTSCALYVHGHSAGGTNPSLVEAMHFGKAVFAFDCDFNRETTENKAAYFSDANSLSKMIGCLNLPALEAMGSTLRSIARRRYTWSIVAQQYLELLRPADQINNAPNMANTP